MKKHIAQGLIGLMVLLSGAVSFAEETTEDDARLAARGWAMLKLGRRDEALEAFRARCTEAGLPGVHLMAIVWAALPSTFTP